MINFVTLLLGAVACVSIGIGIGYKLSHDCFGRMVDDGQIIFRYEDDDESGWDGSEEGIESVTDWVLCVGKKK
jgi:hypothetical protein